MTAEVTVVQVNRGFTRTITVVDKINLQPFIPGCDKRRPVESKDRIE